MWKAFKNVETGAVHAVLMPDGMSPHGFAMHWPMVETDESLTCHLCLRFAYQYCYRDAALMDMLPRERGQERRCMICNVPVSKCCC